MFIAILYTRYDGDITITAPTKRDLYWKVNDKLGEFDYDEMPRVEYYDARHMNLGEVMRGM
jgi:hypothetical protein